MAKETTFKQPTRGHVALLAYDSANDRWQAVYVDASGNLQVDVVTSGLPTGAATETTLSALLTELQAKLETADLNIDAAKDLQVDVKTMPTVTVQAAGSDKVWSIEAAYYQRVSVSSAPAGTNILSGSAPASGKLRIVTALQCADNTSACTQINLRMLINAVAQDVTNKVSPAAGEAVDVQCWIPLEAGDYPEAVVFGATAGDELVANFFGFDMDAP